jgi:UDP-glucuronate 4-epimerase
MYLITGTAGFIGFHLALTLLKKGNVVIGIDNINNYYNKKIKLDRLNLLKKYSKYKFLKIDIANEKSLKKGLNNYKNKIKYIIHLAGQAGVRYSIKNPITYIENNVKAYVNLLEIFKKSRTLKLFIYASSSSVYGEVSSKKSISSKPQVNPISVYSASKLSMELISKVYNFQYNINLIGVRFFSVYGPWGRPDMFYMKYLNSIKSNKPIKIFNFGNHYRSFTYIDDVVLNLSKIINKFKNRKVCEVFNIGNQNSIFLKNFIKALEKITKKKAKKIYINLQLGDLKTTKANISREKKIFNHEVKTSLETGLRKLVTWYRNYYK